MTSARTPLVRLRLAVAPLGTRRDRALRLARSALRLWHKQGLPGVWSRTRSRIRRSIHPFAARVLVVPPASLAAPGGDSPFGIDPVSLAAIEAIDQPLDPAVDPGTWQPLIDDRTPQVMRAYVVRILEATNRTLRRREFFPRCRVRVHPGALRNDFLAMALLHQLCAIRDVRLEFPDVERTATAPPSADRTSLHFVDDEVGAIAVAGDGVQTLTCLRDDGGPAHRVNVGAALRQPSELLGGGPQLPRVDVSGGPLSVSIVIPVFDRTDELLAALASVLNQDYPWCEVILVMNGSPQPTLRLAPKIRQLVRSRRYRGRFLILPNAYGGANVPRNIGSFLATGDLLLFLDSDDALASRDFITRLAAVARDVPECDLFYPRTVEFVNVGRDHPIRGTRVSRRPDVVTWDVLYERGNALNNSGVCVRRSAFTDVGGLDPAMEYCEDYELFLRILGRAGQAIPISGAVRILLHAGNNEIRYESQKAEWHDRARRAAVAFHSRARGSSGDRQPPYTDPPPARER